MKPSRLLIIGVGNEHRGDDAAGLLVVRRLREEPPIGVDLIEQSGEGASLMEAWSGYSRVVLIDAATSGAPPGTILRLDVSAGSLPATHQFHSSHQFGVAQAVETARALNRLPKSLLIFAVAGRSFGMGEPISPEVSAGIESIISRIKSEIITLA